MPIPANQRMDFSFITDEAFEYKWEGIQNTDSSLIDLSAITVGLSVYDRSTPPILQFQLTPISSGVGFASFGFTALQANITGPYNYVIQNITDPSNPVTLVNGVLTFVDPNLTIAFSDIMANEIPPGLVIPPSFIATDQAKWRAMFLSKPGNNDLINATQNDPSTWPMVYNFLIAKLIVYDFMLIAIKAIAGGDLVTKIITGPAETDFANPKDIIKLYGGPTAVDALKNDICELASTLTIFLLVCGKRKVPFVPQIQGLPRTPRRFLLPILSRFYYP